MTVNFSVPLPSQAAQAEVLTFFALHFRTWQEFRPGPDPAFGDILKGFYSPGTSEFFEDPFAVGFVLGPLAGSERIYLQAIVAFTALRWGCRKLLGDARPRPFIRYEETALPLFLDVAPEILLPHNRWQAVDRLGIPLLFRRIHRGMNFVFPGDLEIIEQELLRLDSLMPKGLERTP